jgi:hypothetical protein
MDDGRDFCFCLAHVGAALSNMYILPLLRKHAGARVHPHHFVMPQFTLMPTPLAVASARRRQQ